MAQIARSNEAEKATNETAGNVAELGKRTADKAVGATREAAEKTQDAARRGFEYAQRTFGATAELGHAVARRSAEGRPRSARPARGWSRSKAGTTSRPSRP